MNFVNQAILKAACLGFLLCGHLGAAPFVELGPMLGHVGPDNASFWFKASGPGTPSIVIGQREDLSDGKSHPGIYHKFSRDQVEFFMLDVRYHRSPDKMIDDGIKTMLGERQLAWLKDGLKNSKAKIKIIASGSEWQRSSHADSWASYPREREAFFDFLREEKITGILLISGDRHFTGGYQIGCEFIEITAGPLGARNFPTKNLPEMFFNQSEGKLYAVFDIDTTSETPKVGVEVHRPGDGIVHIQELPWSAILGQQKLETLPIESTPEKAPFQIPFDPKNALDGL